MKKSLNKVKALIDGQEFNAEISLDGKFASLFSVENDSYEEAEFMGRFEIKGTKLIEVFPMTKRRKVIGKLKFS